jgi:hypothetical protein
MDDNHNGVCDYSGHRWGYEKKVMRMANEANALGPLWIIGISFKGM